MTLDGRPTCEACGERIGYHPHNNSPEAFRYHARCRPRKDDPMPVTLDEVIAVLREWDAWASITSDPIPPDAPATMPWERGREVLARIDAAKKG